jgi:hypothetical protein
MKTMKNTRFFSPLALALIFASSSCKKNELTPTGTNSTGSFSAYLQNTTINNASELGYIDFSCIGTSDGGTTNNYTHFYGALFTNPLDSGGNYMDVGTISISNSNGSFSKSHANVPPYFQTNISGKSSLFGSSATVFFPGNPSLSIDTFSNNFYLPLPVMITSSTSSTISSSSSYQINWNTDVNNQNGIVIGIYYSSMLNRIIDSTMLATDKLWTVTTTDNGSYIIPSSVLSTFPPGSHIDIYVGRAAATPYLIGNSKSINLFSSSYTKLSKKLN